MPRILAIDWDRKEARALVLNSGPTGTSISGVWTARLDTLEGVPLTGKQLGARLAEVMGEGAVGKATTIVGVGRDNVQIKLLSLPPAPDNELPDLVRFQAEREFTALGSEAALDYIPLSGSDTMQHTVLAVALSPAGINEAREVSQAAGLEPDRVTVRALAAVSFVSRAGAIDAGGVSLVVNPLGDEADLSVVDRGKVVLMRTVRLPDSEQAVARQRTLNGEIRRTIAAARQQSADRPVDQLVMCGNSAGTDKVDGLGEDLGIPVTLFDPVANAPSGLTGTLVPPASLSRFSAVLGMALAEADRKPPIVDFLNVRRRVEKQRFTRTHAIAAAAAAIVVLAIAGTLWRMSASVTRELADLEKQIADQEAQLKGFGERLQQYAAVEKWKATDANWLEVLTRVSEGLRSKPINLSYDEYQADPFPINKDIFVKALLFTKPGELNAKGGEIQLTQAIARNSAAVTDLQARVRNDPRGLSVKMGPEKDDKTVPGYNWGFSMKISVEPRTEPTEIVAPANPSPAVTTTPPAAEAPPSTEANKQAADAGKQPATKSGPETAAKNPPVENKAQPAKEENK
jgi:Tfp pilus assembly PilM family ATPase